MALFMFTKLWKFTRKKPLNYIIKTYLENFKKIE